MAESRPLRICFVMFGAYPLFNQEMNETFGGSEVELYNLAVYMAGKGLQVDFIVGDYGQKDVEVRENVRLIRVRYMNLEKYSSFIHKLLRYFYLFREFIRQPSDIFITKTASELLGWLVIIEKLLKGRKVVFRLGSDKDADFDFWKSDMKKYFLYKFGIRRCSMVYSQSLDQERMLRERYRIESNVRKNVFCLNNKEEKRSDGHILWVSRCEPLKRPLLFTELARRMPEEKFIMIMPQVQKKNASENECIAEIIEEVRRCSEELDNFRYIDYVPFHLIQSYYNSAKLFINTSEYEGFPNSFIQACLAGTGILSFRVNPDVILTGYGLGHCCRDNMEEAVEYIRSLNGAKMDELEEKALNYVKENHNICTVGEMYIEDFYHLAAEKLGFCGDF